MARSYWLNVVALRAVTDVQFYILGALNHRLTWNGGGG